MLELYCNIKDICPSICLEMASHAHGPAWQRSIGLPAAPNAAVKFDEAPIHDDSTEGMFNVPQGRVTDLNAGATLQRSGDEGGIFHR